MKKQHHTLGLVKGHQTKYEGSEHGFMGSLAHLISHRKANR